MRGRGVALREGRPSSTHASSLFPQLADSPTYPPPLPLHSQGRPIPGLLWPRLTRVTVRLLPPPSAAPPLPLSLGQAESQAGKAPARRTSPTSPHNVARGGDVGNCSAPPGGQSPLHSPPRQLPRVLLCPTHFRALEESPPRPQARICCPKGTRATPRRPRNKVWGRQTSASLSGERSHSLVAEPSPSACWKSSSALTSRPAVHPGVVSRTP